MTHIVTCRNVTFKRDGQQVLNDINWTINQGEHWCILGLNGSGKTSLLNLINGYAFPTTGTIAVLGNEFGKTNLPNLRKRIGYVSSSLDRFLHIMQNETTEEIVASGKYASFGLYEHLSDLEWERVDDILETLRLQHLKGKFFSVLSQGEKRRVLIGRALMNNPDILILDEPCTGLDVLTREELISVMNEISARGSHIIYVTHHIEEISDVITNVLMIRDGEVVESGRKDDVLTNESLSTTFKLPVSVRWIHGRPWLNISTQTNENLSNL
ncbi:ABC transporter ATP-binding protein [Shouchella lehensis]|uniref:ABC transporter ATP-binding protein n=1 Tax=Shouchella lehensis TaxID=300825 RepID=A0A4Y7WJN8_9BACI|nr:ABC transporter ATP-binding protein [Shouchella lehensis]MBG9785976.1 molybdenum ABC transporter ATP-binding protein [Shouchella lehensis]RQW20287.1 ABC transporter ATP-binding protein [Bacillus sp. C1-1]TES48456.1 ABC transporter ATP-binding protein [Shouchella lehensis]